MGDTGWCSLRKRRPRPTPGLWHVSFLQEENPVTPEPARQRLVPAVPVPVPNPLPALMDAMTPAPPSPLKFLSEINPLYFLALIPLLIFFVWLLWCLSRSCCKKKVSDFYPCSPKGYCSMILPVGRFPLHKRSSNEKKDIKTLSSIPRLRHSLNF